MEYYEAADFLFDLQRYAERPGTDVTRDLLAAVGDPHADLRCVQIAGSNGKGSTARMLERVLREAGLDVGLFTSPHLEDLRERVQINGRRVSRAAVVEFVEGTRPYVTGEGTAGRSPSFFEVLTALALWEFDRQDVDVAIMEVGIGGQYDPTSVVEPVAGAVTSVTLEHTGLLGDTEAEIARDMAHVAPEDAPLVACLDGDALAAAADHAGDVIAVGGDVTVTYGGREGLEGDVTITGPDWTVDTKLPLLGPHQAENAAVAATLARQVSDVPKVTVERGLRNAHWPGRFEVMNREPLVVLDGAHTPSGLDRLRETLSSFDYDDWHVVVGAMVDKDLDGAARRLADADRAVVARPAVGKAEAPDVVAEALADHVGSVETEPEVEAALARALDAADPGDAVVVTGSLYAVREARRRWSRQVVPKRVDTAARGRTVLSDANVDSATADRTAGETSHRVLRTRLQPRQARVVRTELLDAGGSCAVSALADHAESVEVVTAGTLAAYERLFDRLESRGGSLVTVADHLRMRLADDAAPDDPTYPWQDGTAVMGILNVTPDSFHDGGEYNAVDDAVRRAKRQIEAGADILDIGGESTRPGADPVPVEEEIDRVVPVVEALADLDAAVSVDTRKAPVARAALDAGADILNDVSGLEDPEMRLVAAEYDVPVVVMHSINTPVDPDSEIHYDDVVEDVLDQLTERVLLAEKAGLDREQILVDPGIGFGKTPAESFELLGRLDEFRALGCPILVGHSHKSLFGYVGEESGDRLEATVAGTAVATERGADVVRVHDVPENVAAVNVAEAAQDPERFQ